MKTRLALVTLIVFVSFCGACGGGGGNSTPVPAAKPTTAPTAAPTSPPTATPSSTPTPATSGSNEQPIEVNGGPQGNYINGLFTSVMVCVPGTTDCQTISNVLVDTGSYGLRILGSALTISLPGQTSGGNAVAECAFFADSFTWGPVATADVELSGKVANNAPLQIVGATGFLSPPPACTKRRPAPGRYSGSARRQWTPRRGPSHSRLWLGMRRWFGQCSGVLSLHILDLLGDFPKPRSTGAKPGRAVFAGQQRSRS